VLFNLIQQAALAKGNSVSALDSQKGITYWAGFGSRASGKTFIPSKLL